MGRPTEILGSLGQRVPSFIRKPWVIGIGALLVGVVIGAIPSASVTDQRDDARADLDMARAETERIQGILFDEQEKTRQLRRELTRLEAPLRRLADDKEALADREAAIARQQGELDDRAAGLDARAQELTAAEQTLEQNTIPDGIWELGRDYEAGTYRASGGGGCYWEKLQSPSGDFSDIIANGGFSPNQTLVIDSPYFSTDGCGEWVKIG
jgi:hypothetical protein